MKAVTFGDKDIADAILADPMPDKQKKMSRLVKNYDESKWAQVREQIMEKCCIAKFDQNIDCKQTLVETGTSMLAESTAFDKIWGTGIAIWDEKFAEIDEWKGLNLMGKVLMKVRAAMK